MRTAALLALVGSVVLVGAGVGAAVGGVPGLPWDRPDGPRITETGLHAFETAGPTCADPRSGNESTFSRPVPGGRRLSIEDNVSVAARGTDLTADLGKIGPRRYHLSLERRPGSEGGNESGTADCHLELRYNATLNVSTPDSYTVVVTVDGELEKVLWATPHASGGSSRSSAPEPGAGDGDDAGGTGSAGGSAAGSENETGDAESATGSG